MQAKSSTAQTSIGSTVSRSLEKLLIHFISRIISIQNVIATKFSLQPRTERQAPPCQNSTWRTDVCIDGLIQEYSLCYEQNTSHILPPPNDHKMEQIHRMVLQEWPKANTTKEGKHRMHTVTVKKSITSATGKFHDNRPDSARTADYVGRKIMLEHMLALVVG